MSTFMKCAATTGTGSCDPTKHVKYTLGMVLGVDDLDQDFTYLMGRHRSALRYLEGYGTVSGLAVSSEVDVRGPRVVVSPGAAVSPCGQMIRVPTAQCAYLNDWLRLDATRRALAERGAVSPGTLRLFAVLGYRDCPTDDVPIPGEPCRSEDDLMAPSRFVDDFTLELRLDPPAQVEEDAVRDFVSWLAAVEVDDAEPSTPLGDFLDAIRDAADAVASPPDFLVGSPPASLVVNTADASLYVRSALRLWVTELRPRWRLDPLGSWSGCCGETEPDDGPVESGVLLAQVDVPILIPGGGGDWQVDDPAGIVVDDGRRPYLLHARMLRELMFGGIGLVSAPGVPEEFVRHPAGMPAYGIVAAGTVRGDNGNGRPAYNKLQVVNVAAGELTLGFDGYTPPDGTFDYVVKTLPVPSANVKTPSVQFLEFRPAGFALRVVNGAAAATVAALAEFEVMVEVSQFPFVA